MKDELVEIFHRFNKLKHSIRGCVIIHQITRNKRNVLAPRITHGLDGKRPVRSRNQICVTLIICGHVFMTRPHYIRKLIISFPFSNIFSLKPWKLRGKVVFLQKKSCTRQIESKLSLRSFAFSLQKKKLHSAN